MALWNVMKLVEVDILGWDQPEPEDKIKRFEKES